MISDLSHEGDMNGNTPFPKVSDDEDKRERRRGQKWIDKTGHFEAESEECRGLQAQDKTGPIIIPKAGDEQDPFGGTPHPKNGLSYKLNTEITNKEVPPPLTPPPSPRQEEEEKSKTDKKEGSQLFQQMVDVWNAQVQSQLYDGSQALLTSQRLTRMAVFLNETTVSDLASWDQYCQMIRTSRFLMGENSSGFRVTLDWALNPVNTRKILEGAIYDKPKSFQGSAQRVREKPWSEYASLLKQHCAFHGYADRWFEACKVLTTTLGQATFENWFKEMAPVEFGNVVQLTVKSAFLRDYIQTYYETALKKAIQAAYPSNTCYEIHVGGDPPPPALPGSCVDQAGRDLKV